MNRFLNRKTSSELLLSLQQNGVPTDYDFERHRLLVQDASGQELAQFRLPITVPVPPIATAEKVRYVILLVQSGSCAVGYFEDGKNLDHKVIRAYMVRKKQGKSQIKHLKTKGKSRAGSRVRLEETLEFFEAINTRLQVYFKQHQVDRVAISCSKILVPYLFGSQVATPFDQHDPRLLKIPMHVHTPIYEILLEVNRFLLKGELIYEPQHHAFLASLLPFLQTENSHDSEGHISSLPN
ncbi:hypothetical protein [Rufibacter sp. LB8]|uniref:hypothetical protein n=1 Tax=Rufibacter sp. LB8 TaxID=2777781 RepID=UPI00178C7491|nr:hypothetical protein [Rufibacter sp. LB8]